MGAVGNLERYCFWTTLLSYNSPPTLLLLETQPNVETWRFLYTLVGRLRRFDHKHIVFNAKLFQPYVLHMPT